MRAFITIVLMAVFGFVPAQAQPPTIKKVPKVFTEHGHSRQDDYFWLSDKSDSNVIKTLTAENEYTTSYLSRRSDLQQKMYEEMVARIPGKDRSLPRKKNGYWYYSKFEDGKQYPYYMRRKGSMQAPEETILDVPAMAVNHKIFLVNGMQVANDNEHMVYGINTSGDRRYTLHVKNLRTKDRYADSIQNTSGNYAWYADNKTIMYVVHDHTVRPFKVMRHVLGTNPSADKILYTESDSTYSIYLTQSKNGRYLFIVSQSTNTNEARFVDASNADGDPVLIQPREVGLKYIPDYFERDVFHIYTNKDAKNFKVVTAPVHAPGMANWKDFIPAKDNVLLSGVEVLKSYIITQTVNNGLTQINVLNRKSNKWTTVPFDQQAYVANMYLATDEYASDSIRYQFSSLVTPPSEYLYNLKTGTKKLLKKMDVGKSYQAARYETRRIWSTSRDGVRVPISIVYRKDLFKKDGSNPLYLYAYGSYGASSFPYFSSPIISLLDRGVVYAIAHIRGGQEMGREWYEEGRVLKKKNTFNDFVDAAEFLVKEKYTANDRLFANGVSAGGMLMGAVVNMRPELFRGVIAEVPWMDVITDMFDTDLPLTTLEYDEWGNPNNKEEYEYLLTWSPLDNVKPAKFPAIFATGGLNDTQVPYFSPAKWVARIREKNLGTHPVLFRVNMGAGHGGESGRYARQMLQAEKFTFVLDQLGWNEQSRRFNIKKPL